MSKVLKVYMQGSCFAGSIRSILAGCENRKFSFRSAKTLQDADVVLYTGGADISPQLYGEPSMASTYVSYQQDTSDQETYHEALRLKKFQVGICRGAQFLSTMAGGKLWQDVDKHAGPNHEVEDTMTKTKVMVSSLHHQGIVLPLGAELLAWCNRSTHKVSNGRLWDSKISPEPSVDVEAFWIGKTKALGVQWHPECGPNGCVELFFDYIERYYEDEKEETGNGTSGAMEAA